MKQYLAGMIAGVLLGTGFGVVIVRRPAPVEAPSGAASREAEILRLRSELSDARGRAGRLPSGLPPAAGLQDAHAQRDPGVQEPLATRLSQMGRLLRAKSNAEKSGRNDLGEIENDIEASWRDLREASLIDLATLGAFLQLPENEDICFDLLWRIQDLPAYLSRMVTFNPTKAAIIGDWKQFIKPVLDAVQSLMDSGSPRQKAAATGVACELAPYLIPDHPLVDRCVDLLKDPDPGVARLGLDFALRHRSENLDSYQDSIGELWEKCDDPGLRAECLKALSVMNGPQARQVLFNKISEVIVDHREERDAPLRDRAVEVLQRWSLDSTPQEQESLRAVITSAFSTIQDPGTFQLFVNAAVDLPLGQATGLLERAFATAPTQEIRDAIRSSLDRIRAGETRPDLLRIFVSAAAKGHP